MKTILRTKHQYTLYLPLAINRLVQTMRGNRFAQSDWLVNDVDFARARQRGVLVQPRGVKVANGGRWFQVYGLTNEGK